MDLNLYQARAKETARDGPDSVPGLAYVALGLNGEAGELANDVKKIYRDGVFNRAKILEELGDVLWYVATLATELDTTLDSVALRNLMKLEERNAAK